MEKTKTLLFMLPAVALFLFVACSGENDLTAETPTAQQKETPSNAIGFDAYLNRTTTRAGWAGELNLTNLQSTGFGVFAYYGDGDLYSENLVPNFMYNQHVTYATDKWTYEPVKYWPNEFGSSAVSVGVDRVSFFAYAPYVAVEPSSGLLTSYYDNTIGTPGEMDEYEKLTETGITWLSRNGKGGDPYVRYVTSFESAKCVDLCYGLAAENFTSSVDGGDGINNVKKGQPYLNVAKPTTDSRIKFDFKHALAKLKVQVDADVDVASHSDGGDPDVVGGMTRVWVRSITFEGVSQRGFLNMRTGAWHEVMDGKKISHATVTIYDGRRDGSEAIADDTYEEITGFNSALVQSGVYTTTVAAGTTFPYTSFDCSDATRTGVTADYKNLFNGATGELMVIPANEQLKVTIVYDVETADATLPKYLSDGKTKGSTIENKITKAITLGGNPLKLESGNAYTINLHLGLNSVKFDATVSDWDDATGGETDLPANVPVYEAAASTPTPATATISSAEQKFEFKISGLNTGEAVTADTDPASAADVTELEENAANASGVAYESITVAANTTVKNRTITPTTWTGSSSSKGVILTLTQQAHALGLGVAAFTDEKTLKLTSTASGTDWSSLGSDLTVTVLKNGVAASGTFSRSGAGTTIGTFELTNDVAINDIYTITVEAGDAPAETYTVHIGGIYYPQASRSVTYGTTDFAYVPTKVGTGNWTATEYTESVAATATVNGTTGVITTAGVNSNAKTVITASATIADADNWYYTTKTKKASYDLYVTPQAAKIVFSNQSIDKDNFDSDKVDVTLKDSKDNDLSVGDSAGGTIAFTVNSASSGTYSIDSEGTVSTSSAGTYPVTLNVTVTVTAPTTGNYSYTPNTATATITITE